MIFARLERYWLDLVLGVFIVFAYLFGWLDSTIHWLVEFFRHLSIAAVYHG